MYSLPYVSQCLLYKYVKNKKKQPTIYVTASRRELLGSLSRGGWYTLTWPDLALLKQLSPVTVLAIAVDAHGTFLTIMWWYNGFTQINTIQTQKNTIHLHSCCRFEPLCRRSSDTWMIGTGFTLIKFAAAATSTDCRREVRRRCETCREVQCLLRHAGASPSRLTYRPTSVFSWGQNGLDPGITGDRTSWYC
jgi:hypothetical protein